MAPRHSDPHPLTDPAAEFPHPAAGSSIPKGMTMMKTMITVSEKFEDDPQPGEVEAILKRISDKCYETAGKDGSVKAISLTDRNIYVRVEVEN